MFFIGNQFSQVPFFRGLICDALLMLKTLSGLMGYGFVVFCGFMNGVGRILIWIVLLKVVVS